MKQDIKIYLLAIVMLLLQQPLLHAQARLVLDFNKNWMFKLQYMVSRDSGVRVTLPHTWNAVDAGSGRPDYFRGTGNYTRSLFLDSTYSQKRLFLKFNGAGSVTDVFINGNHAGHHAGGYTAFCMEITEYLKPGRMNLFQIKVNNAHDMNVLPLEGDFVVYGGIYQPLELLVLNKDCISPLGYGASGVSVKQQTTRDMARLQIKTDLSLSAATGGWQISTIVRNKEGRIVFRNDSTVAAGASAEFIQPCSISRPHLWNGLPDPYLYSVTVLLKQQQQLLDSVTQMIGLRYYQVDPQQGFLLNGQPYDLQGVSWHESSAKNGNALSPDMHLQDLALIKELGATAVRLTHYPHSQIAYDYCDSVGLIAWSEIPFVGPGGSLGAGFYNTDALKANAKQQLLEMIRQNSNHPSVCFWGLYNELENNQSGLVPFLSELNKLAHDEDPGRLTTVASNQDFNDSLNYVADLVAWNKYYGWYGHSVDSIGKWFDKVHAQKPGIGIGISEFGAGASLVQHDEVLTQPAPKGRWHPEEWQTYFHEQYWRQLSQRPYVWCKFIWVMFDFYSAYRTEGDTDGTNDKGLVSMDRKTKKDAFYFYQANWTKAPMLHLAEKRLQYRTLPQVNVKTYTNADRSELFVNGISRGYAAKEYGTCVWKNITLRPGANTIEVIAIVNGKKYQDKCTWFYQQSL